MLVSAPNEVGRRIGSTSGSIPIQVEHPLARPVAFPLQCVCRIDLVHCFYEISPAMAFRLPVVAEPEIPVGAEVSASGRLASMAETTDSNQQRQSSDPGFAGRTEARDGLRQRQMPQPDGVLQPANGDLHDLGERLHAALRFLCGASRSTAPIARSGRTRACRRGGRPTGVETCGDHQRDPRRPSRRWRGSLLSVRGRGSGANRSQHGSADARLCPLQAGPGASHRGPPRRFQSQHGNRAAVVSASSWSQERLSVDAGDDEEGQSSTIPT